MKLEGVCITLDRKELVAILVGVGQTSYADIMRYAQKDGLEIIDRDDYQQLYLKLYKLLSVD